MTITVSSTDNSVIDPSVTISATSGPLVYFAGIGSGTLTNNGTLTLTSSSSATGVTVYSDPDPTALFENNGVLSVTGSTALGVNYATTDNSGTITVTGTSTVIGTFFNQLTVGASGDGVNSGSMIIRSAGSVVGVDDWNSPGTFQNLAGGALSATTSSTDSSSRATGVIMVYGRDLENAGLITASAPAGQATGVNYRVEGAQNTVVNTGTITASGNTSIGVLIGPYGGVTATVTLQNSGTITAQVAVEYQDAIGANIVNTGVINGSVQLGNGTNTVDSHSGTINGAVVGGTGADIIAVGAGSATLTGGGGNDTFIISTGAGKDVVTDFNTASDVIDLSAFFSNSAALQAATSQQGANTVIQLGNSGSLTLDNVMEAALVARNFVFDFGAIAPLGGGTVTGTALQHYAVNFEGAYHEYTVGAGGATVSGGPEGGTDTLVNIQRIQFVDGYLATSPTDTAGEVYRLYEAALGRAPDAVGLSGWVYNLNNGANLQTVAADFVGSQEFHNTYGVPDVTGLITLLYNNVLHRAPDPGGLAGWQGFMAQGHTDTDLLLGFTQSQEDINDSAAVVQQGLWIEDPNAAEVARLYDTTLSRLPDATGLAGWTHALESGTSLLQVTQGFMNSAEFQASYGNLSDQDFVTLLYENTLHRAPDPGGMAGWLGALSQGVSRAQVVLGFSDSQEHINNTAPHIDAGIWLTA